MGMHSVTKQSRPWILYRTYRKYRVQRQVHLGGKGLGVICLTALANTSSSALDSSGNSAHSYLGPG